MDQDGKLKNQKNNPPESKKKPGSIIRHGPRRQKSSESDKSSVTPMQQEKWLLANYDPEAKISTISSNICLADLNHDGDYRLLIGDIGQLNDSGKIQSKLKVYHGTYLQMENLLVDVPCGVAVIHNDKPELTSSIIVASSSYLYVYRNMKPFYKFSLPPLETNQIELDAWTRYRDGKISINTLEEILDNLRMEIGLRKLTSRSLILLKMKQIDYPDLLEMRQKFSDHYKNQLLKKMNVITCLCLLKKTVSETNSASCLILGTENQNVYILEIEAFTILTTAELPSVPVFIQCTGLYDVEYRILFACRDAHIYLIKRGHDTGRLCIQLNSQPVGLARIGTNILVAAMDQTLSIYTNKGNRIWHMKQSAIITCLEEVILERHGLNLVAVALTNRTIVFYNDRKCVDILVTDQIIVAMKYGRFGREDNTLVLIGKDGSLTVKILKRTAQFFELPLADDSASQESNSSKSRLVIPKKTKLFVDQTMREREQYLSIHKIFEQELLRLKLTAYRTYVEANKKNLNPISTKNFDSIKLSAKVIGLGPIFQLQLELKNNNYENFLNDLLMIFDYDSKIYNLNFNTIRIGCLLPNIAYRYQNKVICINELNVSDSIKIYISHENEEIPLLTVIINMPKSELATGMVDVTPPAIEDHQPSVSATT